METHFTDLQKQHALRPGEIVIEIDDEHQIVKETHLMDSADPFNPTKVKIDRKVTRAGNCHRYFPPVSERKNGTNTIRTRQELIRNGARERQSYDPALADIDAIPGERIHVHLENRIGRITDAIFDPENDSICMRLVSVASNMERSSKGMLMPGEYIEVDLRDDTTFWNWVFWMRKICDGDPTHNAGPERNRGCADSGPRFCRPIQNVHLLPTLAECAASKEVLLDDGSQWFSDERNKALEEKLKKKDPDYVPTEGGRRVLTPYLAGIKAQ